MSSTEGCEIGSVPLPDISGLMSTITSFSQKYGELHPYIALFLCITGKSFLIKYKFLKDKKLSKKE